MTITWSTISKTPIIFRGMRTQGGHNAEVRLSISCPSGEKTDSQIHRLKPTLPVYHRFYWKRHRLLISPTFENSKIWMDPLISVVSLDRPGSRHPKPIWILAYRRFCIFSNFQITEFENILNQIGYEEFIGEFECYIKS